MLVGKHDKDGNPICPVCGSLLPGEIDEFEDCAKCGWEDDHYQIKYPDLPGSNGSVTLNQAIANYKKTGRAYPNE